MNRNGIKYLHRHSRVIALMLCFIVAFMMLQGAASVWADTQTIEMGKTYSGEFNEATGSYVYNLNLTANGRLSFTFDSSVKRMRYKVVKTGTSSGSTSDSSGSTSGTSGSTSGISGSSTGSGSDGISGISSDSVSYIIAKLREARTAAESELSKIEKEIESYSVVSETVSDIDVFFIIREKLTNGEVKHIKTLSLPTGSSTVNWDLLAGNYEIEVQRKASALPESADPPSILRDEGKFSFTGSFTSVQETYTAADDNINLIRNYSAVPFDTDIYGFLALNDGTDYYKLELPSSGRLKIRLHSDITKVDVNMIQSDESTIIPLGNGRMSQGDKTFTYDLLAGTYYLKFNRYNRRTGTYDFALTFKASGETVKESQTAVINTYYAAKETDKVKMSTAYKGQLAYNDQYDYYKFILPSDGRLSLSIKCNIGRLGADIYESDGTWLMCPISSTYMRKGSHSAGYDLKRGTYYLRFSRYNQTAGAGTGTYSFTLKFKKAGTTYKKQVNSLNAAKNAAVTPRGRWITGQIAYNDKCDYYKIRTRKAGICKLTINSKIKDMKFYIMKADGTIIRNTDLAYYHDKGKNTYKYKLGKGTYYVLFERYKTSYTGVYKFRVK